MREVSTKPPSLSEIGVHRRAKNRDKVRRWRERQRKCQAVATVVYDGPVVDLLVELGEITRAEVADKDLVGRAIANALRRAARERKLL